MKRLTTVLSLLLTICLLFSGCGIDQTETPSSTPSQFTSDNITEQTDSSTTSTQTPDKDNSTLSTQTPDTDNSTSSTQTPTVPNKVDTVQLSSIPAFSGKPYVAINNNIPNFSESDYTTKSYEFYSDLDNLGRCGIVIACIGTDIMPTEERGSIGQVKPTGWHTVKYDCVDGKYLYNRCHLIGYQLSGENANTKNLITGTRFMNVDGMLPFENMVADYVKETDNHVLYRVTPIFDGSNLLATGVQMEAYSIEDDGDGICFNVFVYNAQPQISINYANGDSSYIGDGSNDVEDEPDNNTDTTASYILNKNTKKFHYPSCSSVDRMKESNKEYYTGSREELIVRGYDPCGNCHP